MSTGDAIKVARRAAGLTQAQLAHRLGVTPQTVSQYERGLINPKLETLQKFADALGVDAWTLVDAGDSSGPDLPAGTPDKARAEIEQMAKQRAQILETMKLEKEREKELLDQMMKDFQLLSDEGQTKAAERVHELTEIVRYQNPYAIALEDYTAKSCGDAAADDAAGDGPADTDTNTEE